MMRIGCCAPIALYDQIVRAGYDYVEFPAWEVEAATEEQLHNVYQKIEKANVPCLRLNAYCKGTPAIVGEAFSSEQTAVYAGSLMKKAAILHVERIGVGAPPARRLPEGYDRKLADQQSETFLQITAAAAAKYEIDILLEALQKNVCNYMNDTRHALAVVQKLNLKNLALVVDLYHMETQGESWEALNQYLRWTRHMHVSTVGEGLRRGLYKESDESYCDETFSAIARSEYNGTVSIEPDSAELVPNAVKTALDLMRQACARAGI